MTEILVGIWLQAGFIIVLCGAFYMMLNFYVRTTKILSAREKGQRVISFVESRVVNAGLGLWKCNNSREIVNALSTVTPLNDDFTTTWKTSHKRKMSLPVAITLDDTGLQDAWRISKKISEDENFIRGNILTVLYAQKVTGTDNNLLVKVKSKIPLVIVNGNEFNFADKVNGYKTYEKIFKDGDYNMPSWAVTATAGVPLHISTALATNRQIQISADISKKSIDIAAGMELIPLKCTRFWTEKDDNPDTDTGRDFTYKNLRNDWSGDDEKRKRYEAGILEIFCELNKKTNVLDFYVLASGGRDISLDNPRPKAWPEYAPWNDDYRHHYTYVSRKSWKLYNIPDSFSWD